MVCSCADVACTYLRWPGPALHAGTQLTSHSAYSPPAAQTQKPQLQWMPWAIKPSGWLVWEMILSIQSTSIVSMTVLDPVMTVQHQVSACPWRFVMTHQ